MFTANQEALEESFDKQMQTWIALGVSLFNIEVLLDQRQEVIDRASRLDLVSGHIPFLSVIPRNQSDINILMKTWAPQGYLCLGPVTQIRDKVRVPDQPYFIFDVEIGMATLGKSGLDIAESWEGIGRRGLTMEELMSMAIHMEFPKEYYYAVALASQDRRGRAVRLLLAGRPEIYWVFLLHRHPHFGVPSCSSV